MECIVILLRPSSVVIDRVITLQTFFSSCGVGLPASGVGTVEAKVPALLHSTALQWASGGHKGAQHKGGQPPLASQWH